MRAHFWQKPYDNCPYYTVLPYCMILQLSILCSYQVAIEILHQNENRSIISNTYSIAGM